MNIYALTRVDNLRLLSRYERQLSSRKRFLHVKQWEMVSLRAFTDRITDCMEDAVLFYFYYSFQIPKLGKEFDLLRISDDMVINVELKSFAVPDESIKKQLLQNRYYLSTLGKSIRSYTYISDEDRLVRLTNSGRLADAGFDELCKELRAQEACYNGDIEELFIEERYIISPLASPDRFLMNEYFLTSQQIDIKKHILRNIKTYRSGIDKDVDNTDGVQDKENVADKAFEFEKNGYKNKTGFNNYNICIQGFTGLPGTGKTLLLYDIAMTLSARQRVCVVHCGSYSEELKKLDERLKRIDFFQCSDSSDEERLITDDYSAYLVDEAHLLKAGVLDEIIDISSRKKVPVIFSYDSEELIAKDELNRKVLDKLEGLEGYSRYRLTNRIRTKSELSSFIQAIVQGSRSTHRKEFPSVSLAYAKDKDEADKLLGSYIKQGYTYIKDSLTGLSDEHESCGGNLEDDYPSTDVSDVSFKEYADVVMLVNSLFYYDEDRKLRSYHTEGESESTCVRNLFHGLNRAKGRIALVVYENEPVFEGFLGIAQGWKV